MISLQTSCTTTEAANWYVRNKPLLADGEACPLHWTSYHHTPTGCEAFCAVAFAREGSDGTCMPGKPECANWLDDMDFPDEYITVNTWCICGAKLETEVSPGRYVNRGTIIESFEGNEDDLAAQQDSYAYGSETTSLTGSALIQGRRLQSSTSTSTSKWRPEALKASVTAHHGDHFDVDNTCFEEISSFLTDHIPSTAQCANYMTMTAPPNDLTNRGYDPASPGAHAYCTDDATANDACCVAHRGSDEMSRIWLQGEDMLTRSVSQAFSGPTVVGTAVHTSQVAAIGNFDNDDFPDIVIGNRLYLNRKWEKCDGDLPGVPIEHLRKYEDCPVDTYQPLLADDPVSGGCANPFVETGKSTGQRRDRTKWYYCPPDPKYRYVWTACSRPASSTTRRRRRRSTWSTQTADAPMGRG